MKNRNKMNNNGFSLIELIIVIAIMAVLIGVLAPQYMRYVERGRATADRDNIEAIVNALQVYYVDPDATSTLANGDSITLTRNPGSGTGIATTGAVADAMTNAGLPTTLDYLTNRTTFTSCTITVNITAGANPTITVTAVETP
ncbi:MAG: prepilin-type N-terminal cleavage/methylation domain-containing protein [Lachnospiraceae bacterium]|nr:prepilin-type N-terminal cleavage/methylation domain-containing protein [Lachnospiraceae bacterium]